MNVSIAVIIKRRNLILDCYHLHSKSSFCHVFLLFFFLFFLFLSTSGCVNLHYVESLGKAGHIWSQDSLLYIDVAEQAHNSAYQYNMAIIDEPPKCKQGFRLCLRAWERNNKEKRFNFLRSVASLMSVYTQTLKAMASDSPLEELRRLSSEVSKKMQAAQAAYTNYRKVSGDKPIPTIENFDVVTALVFGVSRIHFDYQRDKAIRKLVKKRYENINRALILYSQAMSALIDSTQVLAGDLHGDFEQFAQAAWSDASKTERLHIMQQSVMMKKLQRVVVLEKICPPEMSQQCVSDKGLLQYKLMLELQALMNAHDKLYFAAKSNLPLDFADFSASVSRLSKF